MPFTYRWMFQDDIVETAERFAVSANQELARLPQFAARREFLDSQWTELRELGWAALMVEEQHGGVGGSLLDLAAMLEGSGRNALPLPLAAAFGIAPLLVKAAGAAGAAVARGIADGTHMLMPVIEPIARCAGGKAGNLRCVDADGALTLEGTLLGVEVVPHATHLLIACFLENDSGRQPALVLCPMGQAGLSTALTKRMDGRTAFDLTFAGVSLDDAMVLATGEPVLSAVERVADLGALLTCVETVAAMGALIEQTIEYLSVRKQFGVPLGTFQVLRHYVAEMVVAYEVANALLLPTLRTVAERMDDFHGEAISLLKVRLSDAGGLVARQAIQLHGGMGITEELLATRLARRIMMAEFEYGDGTFHTERLLTMRQASAA